MEDTQDIAIEIRNLKKDFKLPHNKKSSIKGVFVNVFQRSSYEMQKVLKGLDIVIKKGEFFGIVGRNGSGKSTLLKILAGVYTPDSGDVTINGKLTPFIELGVGFNPELSGRDNVYLSGALLGFSNSEMDEQYEDIVKFAELEKFMDQKLKNYSSGMQVRLAFSIATRANTPILLLDEVLAVGDAAFQRKCYSYFKELKREKTTVILVTHDMDVVREFCDRAILLNEGKVDFSGSAQDAAREYARLLSGNDTEDKATGSVNKRWGDKSISYTNIEVSNSKGQFNIKVTAKAKDDVLNPVFGFVIKLPDGNPVLGTNSYIKQFHVGEIKKNKSVDIHWTFPDIFSNGEHFIDVAITQPDGATVHDWWEDAGHFNIKGKDKNPYSVTPDIKLKIS